MVWHRNSLGILFQRFFFCLILMISIVIFLDCIDTHDSDDFRDCVVSTGIPMIFVLVFVTLKVSFHDRFRFDSFKFW